MFFKKALQNQTEIEGQKEWTSAYELYCKQCSVNSQLARRLKDRTDDAAELLKMRQKREFRKQCQVYREATEKWAARQIAHKLKEKGIKNPSLNVFDVAKILELDLVTTGKDLAMLEKEQAKEKSLTNEELARRSDAAEEYLKYLNKKTGYVHKSYDPTFGDNDPLPESSIAEEAQNEE